MQYEEISWETIVGKGEGKKEKDSGLTRAVITRP